MQSSDNILGQIKLTKTVTYLCSDSLSCDIFCPFFFFFFHRAGSCDKFAMDGTNNYREDRGIRKDFLRHPLQKLERNDNPHSH